MYSISSSKCVSTFIWTESVGQFKFEWESAVLNCKHEGEQSMNKFDAIDGPGVLEILSFTVYSAQNVPSKLEARISNISTNQEPKRTLLKSRDPGRAQLN